MIRLKDLFKKIDNKSKHNRIHIIILCVVLLLSIHIGTTLIVEAQSLEDTSEEFTNEEQFHGFYPAYATYNSQIEGYIDDLDSISFAFGRVEAGMDGLINSTKGKNNNYDFYYANDYIKPITYAKEQGKSVQFSLYMDGKNAIQLLPYDDKRQELIKSIVSLLEDDIGDSTDMFFDGIVIDFEELRNTDSNKNSLLYNGKLMSQYLNLFITELRKEISADEKIYVAVNTDEYYDGYDYATLLKKADRVILMAHDYEPTSQLKKSEATTYMSNDVLQPLDSLTPIQRIGKTLYTIEASLKDASLMSKMWLQLSFDTAQWQYEVGSDGTWESLASTTLSKKGRVAPLYKSIKTRVDNTDGYGKSITYGYNNMLQSPYIHYYNTSDNTFNIILYEDSTSLDKKIELAKVHGLGGISIWGLNNVPDYSDKTGLKYHLDGWDTMVSAMESYDSVVKYTGTYITFSDNTVEQAVRTYLGKPKGKITAYEMKSVYRLKLGSTVKKLNDFKYLTNLEYLSMSGTSVTNTAYLAYAKNLKVAYLSNNKINKLNGLKNLTSLEKLALNNNQIADITPLAGLTKVTYLNLGDNKITSITSLKKLTKLNTLYLQNNSIKNVGTLAYLKKLTFLSMNGNKIVDTTKIGTLTSLKYLYLKNNKITNVTPLKTLTKLKQLYLKGNSIKSYKALKTIASKKGFVGDFKVS